MLVQGMEHDMLQLSYTIVQSESETARENDRYIQVVESVPSWF